MDHPVAGTGIAGIYVDYFGRAGIGYLLTHAHVDHMRGLSDSWCRGEIHCTPTTARLLLAHYPGFRSRLLRTHEYEEPFEVGGNTGFTATFIDANHCSGSAMIVFEGLPGGPVVNTGDFRYSDRMLQSPALRRVTRRFGALQRVQQLRLDVSWANIPVLPSKQHSADCLLDIIASCSDRIFMRSHLGDEEMLRAIALRHPGKKLWFIDQRRYHEFSVAEPSLAASQAAMLHQEPDENVRFVIVRKWTDRFSDRRLRDASGIGICTSTLWFARAGMDMHSPVFDDPLWRVPFSMHSSGEELQTLVSFLDPAVIRPICDPIIGGSAAHLVGHLVASEVAMPAIDEDASRDGDASSELTAESRQKLSRVSEMTAKEFAAECASFFSPTPQVEDDLEALLAGAFDWDGCCTPTLPESPWTLVDTPSPKRPRR